MLEMQKKMQFHIDLRAPTIIVPQGSLRSRHTPHFFMLNVIDFRNKNCPTLIADLGHIVIDHDSTARQQYVEMQDDDPNDEKVT